MEKIIRFIGDVHGDEKAYLKALDNYEGTSIQVGDFGIGFVYPGSKDISVRKNSYFIRGNHDNPSVSYKRPDYIHDGTISFEQKMMFIGGAYSIDKNYRTEGIDYWSDEELSYQLLDSMIDKYIIRKPSIMVTHCCPNFLSYIILTRMGLQKIHDSRTEIAFETMFANHTPKLWIFGHYHYSFDETINNCRFICLNINKTVDINLEDYI